MKLINKISYLYFLNTAVLLAIGLLAMYFTIDLVISEQTDGQLKDAVKETLQLIQKGETVQNSPLIEAVILEGVEKEGRIFKDTTIYFTADKEYTAARELSLIKSINGRYYKITARTSLIEKEDLFSAILIVMSSLLALLFLLLFYVNRKSTKKIFAPFYSNLGQLESFSLHRNESLVLTKSGIEEFTALNNSLYALSEKALKEYNSLREFTDDLSHELQTPVSVIKSKLELVMQKEITDSEIMEFLNSAYQNIARLEKLNRSLILLAKLENTELFNSGHINISERIKKGCADFTEIAEMKNIRMATEIEYGFETEIDENLLDILVSNLISNGIKHNFPGGELYINFKEGVFSVKNTGKEPRQNTETYFERFSYDEKSVNSLGLGLAIVKKICKIYNFQINYTFTKPYHTLTLNFNQSNK